MHDPPCAELWFCYKVVDSVAQVRVVHMFADRTANQSPLQTWFVLCSRQACAITVTRKNAASFGSEVSLRTAVEFWKVGVLQWIKDGDNRVAGGKGRVFVQNRKFTVWYFNKSMIFFDCRRLCYRSSRHLQYLIFDKGKGHRITWQPLMLVVLFLVCRALLWCFWCESTYQLPKNRIVIGFFEKFCKNTSTTNMSSSRQNFCFGLAFFFGSCLAQQPRMCYNAGHEAEKQVC